MRASRRRIRQARQAQADARHEEEAREDQWLSSECARRSLRRRSGLNGGGGAPGGGGGAPGGGGSALDGGDASLNGMMIRKMTTGPDGSGSVLRTFLCHGKAEMDVQRDHYNVTFQDNQRRGKTQLDPRRRVAEGRDFPQTGRGREQWQVLPTPPQPSPPQPTPPQLPPPQLPPPQLPPPQLSPPAAVFEDDTLSSSGKQVSISF